MWEGVQSQILSIEEIGLHLFAKSMPVNQKNQKTERGKIRTMEIYNTNVSSKAQNTSKSSLTKENITTSKIPCNCKT